MLPRALITHGEGRASLAACRCLSAAGYHVGVVAATRPAASHWSGSCDERFHLPDPLESPVAFVQGLEQLLHGRNYSVLLPGSDAALKAISAARERLAQYVEIGLPSQTAIDDSLDKLRLTEVAMGVGLAPPATAICQSADDALAAAERLGYPVMLKPRWTILSDGKAFRRPNTRVVFQEADLTRLLPDYGWPCLVQSREQGDVYSCAGVRVPEGLVALVTSRYLRTWPPQAGEVACSETVEAPVGLADAIEGILAAVGWQGVFEVELIRREDGGFSAIDLNPRLYGSLAAAIAAGAALPAIWCEWLRTGKAQQAYGRPGVTYRWEEGELRHMLWQLRAGEPRRAAAVLRPHPGAVHANLRLSDPGPLMARALELVGLACRGLSRHVWARGAGQRPS